MDVLDWFLVSLWIKCVAWRREFFGRPQRCSFDCSGTGKALEGRNGAERVIRQRLRQDGPDVHSSFPPHSIMSDFLAQRLIAELSPFRS